MSGLDAGGCKDGSATSVAGLLLERRAIMPSNGDTAKARELGMSKFDSAKYVFQDCPKCGKGRWVRRAKKAKLCVSCAHLNYIRGGTEEEKARLLNEGNARMQNGVYQYKHICVCGKEFWHKNKDSHLTCSILCARSVRMTLSGSPRWKGGQRITAGYVDIMLSPDDPYFAMAHKGKTLYGGYVLEHRLVVARHLGRCLESWEIVHHKNGNKLDNRLDNLELLPNQPSHLPSIASQWAIRRLKNQVVRLTKDNDILSAELKALKKVATS